MVTKYLPLLFTWLSIYCDRYALNFDGGYRSGSEKLNLPPIHKMESTVLCKPSKCSPLILMVDIDQALRNLICLLSTRPLHIPPSPFSNEGLKWLILLRPKRKSYSHWHRRFSLIIKQLYLITSSITGWGSFQCWQGTTLATKNLTMNFFLCIINNIWLPISYWVIVKVFQ